MHQSRLALLLFCAILFQPALQAQNFNITAQTPDSLAVCSTDTLRITVVNNTLAPVSGALLDLEMLTGLRYQPGSVSGASESNVANLNKPVLLLPTLQPGVPALVQVQLYAACDLVPAINAAQLFSVTLRVRAGALPPQQVSTTPFHIQTGLLVITQVDNDSVSGEKGDVIIRTIHVQNTRLGAIRYLFLEDVFSKPGIIQVHVPGAASEQSDISAYSAYFDGAFFKNFGDGDALLEFGETVLIREQVTIIDCGNPQKTVRSSISAGWSCAPDEPVCQAHSTFADVVVLPFTKKPNLLVFGEYPLAWNLCAQVPSVGKIKLVNVSPYAAHDVVVQISTIPPSDYIGFIPGSVRLLDHGTVTPLTAAVMDSIRLDSCGIMSARAISFNVPGVPANDSVFVTYEVLYCVPEKCVAEAPVIRLITFHTFGCGFQSLENKVVQRANDNFLADVYYDISTCLQDGQTYDFRYVLQCDRLLGDSGYLWLTLDLPRGLSWSPDCPPTIGGEMPVLFVNDPATATTPLQRIRLAYDLPLNASNTELDFCLKSRCIPDGVYVPFHEVEGPDPLGIFTVYQSPSGDKCGNCGFAVHAAAYLSKYLDNDPYCALPSCNDFRLRTACSAAACGDGGGGGGGGGGVAGPGCNKLEIRESHSGRRTNLGLLDKDDDRIADAKLPADPAKVRLDRLMAGDTLQMIMSTKVVCGDSIRRLFYQLFTEVVRSDFPYGGAKDTFEIGPKLANNARQVMANRDSFQIIRATFSVWDASAKTVYSCVVQHDSIAGTDRLYGLVTPVNVNPAPKQDELASMSYVFKPDLDLLGAAGCLPQGLILQTGDSVALTVDYKLDFNFVPYSKQHYPPLVNFEMGLLANAPQRAFNYRQADTLMFQYTGFRDSLTHPSYGIRACEPSLEAQPFAYTIRLARENLFPYEVRPLNRISAYRLESPGLSNPSTVTLQFLRLQENTLRLQNIPLPFSVSNDGLNIDFGPVYDTLPDEGYALRTRAVFEPNCGFAKPAKSVQKVTLDWTGCLRMPNPQKAEHTSALGFLSNIPRDTMTTDEHVLYFPTPAVGADFLLENKAPAQAPNYWFDFVNPEGGLTDFTVQRLDPPGPVLKPVNGVVQWGTLLGGALENVRIAARNMSCDTQRLIVRYGWDCQPHTQPGAPACAQDSILLLLVPQNPEIELDLLQLPAEVPLCDSSDYIVFEVSNAELGYAYKPFATLELPVGLHLLPGSCQLAYPAGSAFVPIPDPAVAGGITLEWNLAALQAAVSANGLPGVNLKPQNALQIRFKVMAECGVVSNAQLIFGARAEWSCGKLANALRKASDPLNVEGVAPTYGVQISLNETGPNNAPCQAGHTMAVSLLLSGSALPGDSIYVSLPPGYTYVPGSYQPGANAPGGAPQVQGGVLQWPLPQGLPANTAVGFTFDVLSGNAPNCAGVPMQLQTRQRTSAFCPATNNFCTIYAVTGTADYVFPAADPILKLLSANLNTGSSGQTALTFVFENQSAFPVPKPTFTLYNDLDGNGQLSGPDTVLLSFSLPGLIAAGASELVTLSGAFNGQDICRLLLVLPGADNCDCQDAVYPLKNDVVTYATKTACVGDSALIGVVQQAGHSYSWSTAPGLSCAACATATFQAPGPGLFSFVLTDQGPSCTVERRFAVQVYEKPALLNRDTALCRGASLTLATTPAAQWQWSGPGIANATAPTIVLQPAQAGAYSVTATSAEGCTLQAAFTVTILTADTTDLGVVRTCAGTPVDIFGTATEVPGLYTQTLPNAAGCDSLLRLTLLVTPRPATQETRQRCVGDTLLVFGQAVTAPGVYCDTFPSSLGCDSTHCVVVTDLPIPEVPDPDTIFIPFGGSATLDAPPGFMQYTWIPTDYLNCINCPNPVSTPPDTIAYTLLLTTADGCTDTVIYRVVPFPPCDPARLKLPNAFTPDGDGTNDAFTVVPFEGSEVIRSLRIYNRWGQKIYEASGPNAAWDGTSDGKPAPSDVYVWVLEVFCAEGSGKPRVGDVTLMR